MTGNGEPCSICGKTGTEHLPQGCPTGWAIIRMDDGSWKRETP